MPDYDHDLIASLAEGRLEPEQAAALERAISTDPAASAELAAQRRALDAVRGAPIARLTDEERGRVRLGVATAIGLDPESQGAPAGRRGVPWAAISIAAATLAALIAVVPLTGLLTSNQIDPSAVSLGFAEADDDTSRASPETAPAAPMGGAEVTDATFGDGTGLGSTTVAASDPEMTANFEDDTVERRLVAFTEDPKPEAAFQPTEETGCVAEARALIAADGSALMVIELTIGDQQALVFFTAVEETVAAIAAYSPIDCSLLASLP